MIGKCNCILKVLSKRISKMSFYSPANLKWSPTTTNVISAVVCCPDITKWGCDSFPQSQTWPCRSGTTPQPLVKRSHPHLLPREWHTQPFLLSWSLLINSEPPLGCLQHWWDKQHPCLGKARPAVRTGSFLQYHRHFLCCSVPLGTGVLSCCVQVQLWTGTLTCTFCSLTGKPFLLH